MLTTERIVYTQRLLLSERILSPTTTSFITPRRKGCALSGRHAYPAICPVWEYVIAAESDSYTQWLLVSLRRSSTMVVVQLLRLDPYILDDMLTTAFPVIESCLHWQLRDTN